MDLLKGLSLFSGIGGIDKALEDWVEPIAYCEIEPYCQSVLLSRMQKGDLPKAPIWDDIRSLSFKCSRDKSGIDIIYGGFPCQDISIAGLGKGLAGERSGLVYEIFRLARQLRPTFIFLENVPAITTRGGVVLVQELTKMRYDCRWCIISAASVGALHKRNRWFLLAYSQSERFIQSEFQKQPQFKKGLFERSNSLLAHAPSESADRYTERKEETHPLFGVSCNDGNAYSQPSEQADSCPKPIPTVESTRGRPSGQYWPFESRDHWNEAVSGICRTSDGLPNQVDRLKSLGNAVVPQQVKEAFKILAGLK